MRRLIERQGADAVVAPSMRELPLQDNRAAFEFAEQLFAGRIDVSLFLTGVGTRVLLESLATRYERERIVAAISGTTVIVRGPKPVPLLREWGIAIDFRAAEPNTWREILDLFEPSQSGQVSSEAIGPDVRHTSPTPNSPAQQSRPLDVNQQTIAVQEYGKPNEEFYAALRARGATVLPVPVYAWGMPEETEPLQEAIRRCVDGQFDVLLFTSANQLANVLLVAESLSLKEQWTSAAAKCVIGSIGPTNSEALRAAGLPVDVEASPPKMGKLVQQTLQDAADILSAKRR
ncbi:MAG: uroporphyrinogen-III synthase [Planctomycetes bacterium]|nr:uroporphyrinogen-III synthase [Planctomycetota bacterium]